MIYYILQVKSENGYPSQWTKIYIDKEGRFFLGGSVEVVLFKSWNEAKNAFNRYKRHLIKTRDWGSDLKMCTEKCMVYNNK